MPDQDDHQHQPIRILYRDRDYVAVHKPAGLLVHRSALDSRETRFLVQLVRDQIQQRVYPVQRLDKPTQGVIVLALHSEAARRMQALFTDGTVEKEYLAVVRGYAPTEIVVDYPLRDRPDARIQRRELLRRSAITDLRRLDTIELPTAVGRYETARYSLIECRPQTGRRHQIRRHLKHLRHPIVGDAIYGDGPHNRMWRDQLGIRGLLLAATQLSFSHPYSGAAVTVRAPIEAPMADVLHSGDGAPRFRALVPRILPDAHTSVENSAPFQS